MAERLEIDSRTTPEVEVVVWYIPEYDLCLCSLTELARNRAIEFVVEASDVSEALQHPYAFLYSSGGEFSD